MKTALLVVAIVFFVLGTASGRVKHPVAADTLQTTAGAAALVLIVLSIVNFFV